MRWCGMRRIYLQGPALSQPCTSGPSSLGSLGSDAQYLASNDHSSCRCRRRRVFYVLYCIISIISAQFYLFLIFPVTRIDLKSNYFSFFRIFLFPMLKPSKNFSSIVLYNLLHHCIIYVILAWHASSLNVFNSCTFAVFVHSNTVLA